jgi:hypothetical protein
MRNIVYLDKKIPKTEYKQLQKEYGAFIKEHTGITIEWTTVDYDFTDYPINIDVDGDAVLRPTFMKGIADEVTKRYGDFGFDNIITLIHFSNWKSAPGGRPGIWGTNYSYVYGNYHFQYCRWNERLANSFGTVNHEIDHTFDALVKQEIGIDLNRILNVVNYDRDTTHGGMNPPYQYIRHKENANKLKVLAPFLAQAYRKRYERHVEVITGLQKTVIGLAKQVIYLLRKQINNKNGVQL